MRATEKMPKRFPRPRPELPHMPRILRQYSVQIPEQLTNIAFQHCLLGAFEYVRILAYVDQRFGVLGDFNRLCKTLGEAWEINVDTFGGTIVIDMMMRRPL